MNQDQLYTAQSSNDTLRMLADSAAFLEGLLN